jgi:acrylyl-CoA reductase (NADPH)
LDNVGGLYFDRLAARLQPYGKLAVAGMAVGAELTTTVLPFVLRAVDVLGINVSRQLKMEQRLKLWQRMGSDLKPDRLPLISRPIAFEQLDATMDKFFDATTLGRVVVEVGSKAPSAQRSN